MFIKNWNQILLKAQLIKNMPFKISTKTVETPLFYGYIKDIIPYNTETF